MKLPQRIIAYTQAHPRDHHTGHRETLRGAASNRHDSHTRQHLMNALVTIDHTGPIVSLKGAQIVTNSRDVAAYFEKRHDNVVRDVNNLIFSAPEAALNFEECPYQSVEGGRFYDSFDMTRDGFTLLAMGFTGPKALRFKIAYIAAFNSMEKELQKPRFPDLPNFNDPASAARAWALEYEKAKIAQADAQAKQAVIEEHLTWMTVDEFRAFKHQYWRHGKKAMVTSRALELCARNGVLPKSQGRDMAWGARRTRAVVVNEYPVWILEEALVWVEKFEEENVE